VQEGCVNETVAALDAESRSEATSDPAVRAVLRRISDDEAAHAELAWRFVHWALTTGGHDTIYAVRSALRAPVPSSLDDISRVAWREVIEPVAAQLG
jgi:hypothetical protein